MPRATPGLQEALEACCRRAWEGWRAKYPRERFYAFALYTTPDAAYFVPTISGEEGLTKVAKRYLRERAFETLNAAREGLRWSFEDSPYHAQGERYTKGVDEALDARPIPYEKSERAADREIKSRLDTAVEALQALDKEGVFGRGKEREQIVLLIEAGDRDEEWALKLAKRLNPKNVFAAYAKQFEPEKAGRFTELGSKKVYETRRLALSADGRLLLATCEYDAFLFDTTSGKQLWGRVPRRGDILALHGGAVSGDGSMVVICWVNLARESERGLTIWRGNEWKDAVHARLPAAPMDLVMSPRGEWVAVSGEDNRVYVFGPDGAAAKTLKEHKDWPRGLAASPDGAWLASAEKPGGTILWDTKTWTAAKRLKRPADSVAFGGDTLLVTTLRHPDDDDDPAAQVALVWDVAAGKVKHEVRVPGWKIGRAVLSPDGMRLACGVEDLRDGTRQKAVLLEVPSGKVLSSLAAGFERFNDFAFMGGGKIAVAATGHHRKAVVLWETGVE